MKKTDANNKEINKKKKENQKPMKINTFLYYTLMPILIFLAHIIYNLKIDKSKIKGMKGPFLILGNHTTPIDFLFFTGSIYPKKITYVVAANMYYRQVYGWFIRKFHCIPKRQFTADYTCIKSIKKYLDSNISVLLFPEGRVTIDGTTGYISPSIGKLIKWLGYPVISGITTGGYVSNPKWGKKRTAKIRVEVKPILTAEDIKNMSIDEINELVYKNLQHNDNSTFVENGWKIKAPNLAVGLEKLLYKCPKCGKEFKNVTSGDIITCTECGNTVRYCRDGILRPVSNGDKSFDFINEWADYQRDELKKQIEDPNFKLSDKVKFVINNPKKGQFIDVGEGILTVSKDGIVYTDDKNEYSFNIEHHRSLAFKMGDDLEVAEEDDIYRFIFLEGKYSTKYVMAIEAIYDKYFSKK